MDIDELINKATNISTNYDDYRNILKELKNQLEFEHNLRNKKPVITAQNIDKIVFFGDIHGDFYTFYQLSKKIELINLLKNNWHIVFLGDYIDRGEHQLETLALIALLKTEYPSKIITLRGNHEPVDNNLVPHPHDYLDHLIDRFGETNGLELYELSRELFKYMPLALYINKKILAVHGGPPITRIKKYVNPSDILSIEKDLEAIEDILWSDPVENNIEYINSYRGAGKLWGTLITNQTLKKLNIKLIVRGHEPVNGYRFNHNYSVVTVFTMKNYYGNKYASCLKLDLNELKNEDYLSIKKIVENSIKFV